MNGLNRYVPIAVHTQRGILDTSELTPGDELIEYGSGRRLKVMGIEKVGPTAVWELTYSDGRMQYFNIIRNIFTGDMIISLIQALKGNATFFRDVKIYPVELLHKPAKESLNPDPYIAGALIMYGNYNDEFINLPLDRTSADQLFAHKYNLDHAAKLGDNTVYFRYNGTPDDMCIKWSEFFPNHDFFAKSRKMHVPLIPPEYEYGTLDERRRFISGVFDVGYTPEVFPDSLGIISRHEFRLRELQRMLWGMGVNSKIVYDPYIHFNFKHHYFKLQVVGDFERSTKFFYDINHIRRMIMGEKRIIWKAPEFTLKVTDARNYCVGYTYEPILSEPNLLYLDKNYLPRVSM